MIVETIIVNVDLWLLLMWLCQSVINYHAEKRWFRALSCHIYGSRCLSFTFYLIFLLKVWSCCCCVPRMMWKYLLADYLVHYTTCNVNRTAAPAGLSVCLRVVTVLGVGYQGGPPLPTLAHRPDLSGPGQLSRPGHLHHRHGLEWHHPIQHCPAEL